MNIFSKPFLFQTENCNIVYCRPSHNLFLPMQELSLKKSTRVTMLLFKIHLNTSDIKLSFFSQIIFIRRIIYKANKREFL